MLNRSSQNDRSDRRESAINARQAAEALFAPKPQRVEPVIRKATLSAEAVRKPRVLTIAAAPVPHAQPAVSVCSPPPKEPVIPAAHVGRIRAWLKYGMSPAQVAETYGVTPAEIERILRAT